MAQTNVEVRTVHDACLAVGWSGTRTLTIDRPESAGGMGLGYSGGELLLLALGACYCNDIFREVGKRGIVVRNVQVEVSGDWGGDPVRAQNVSFVATVEAEASEDVIEALMRHTDNVAEIHNSLRMGTNVTLTSTKAVSLAKLLLRSQNGVAVRQNRDPICNLKSVISLHFRADAGVRPHVQFGELSFGGWLRRNQRT